MNTRQFLLVTLVGSIQSCLHDQQALHQWFVTLQASVCSKICNCAALREHYDDKIYNYSLNYRPVVILHGLGSSSFQMRTLESQIIEFHPGTITFNMRCFYWFNSFTPLWSQVRRIGKEIMAIGGYFPNGIDLIGYSQGGLIARAIIETFPEHNVRTFISIAAPQAGQCGLSKFVVTLGLFSNELCKNVYLMSLHELLGFTSLPDMWNDPTHQDLYLKNNRFLTIINNEVRTSRSESFKKGITRLNLMVLLGSPADGVITPWQSSLFGFYGKNNTILGIRQRAIYKTDAFGLKTLDKAKKLIIRRVPNVTHGGWLYNKYVIRRYILRYLKKVK